jgi:hypothetical protein
VIYYLPSFREWLIAHPLSVFTAFLCRFTDSSEVRLAPCPPLFTGVISAFHPSSVHV